VGKNSVNYGAVCAAAFISLVPVLIIFIIFRKQFINSMIDGAIKG
ncbi:MAG TPA: carbohydrate ABC transporter permease, partial [Candidatus Pullilachnospira stercoravium]|nr:carbohydrate ABC transporter permease [Candidatus Pullilachnospira stercoravium]